jgi:hypothetical protein
VAARLADLGVRDAHEGVRGGIEQDLLAQLARVLLAVGDEGELRTLLPKLRGEPVALGLQLTKREQPRPGRRHSPLPSRSRRAEHLGERTPARHLDLSAELGLELCDLCPQRLSRSDVVERAGGGG